jgi:hypothetical protein
LNGAQAELDALQRQRAALQAGATDPQTMREIEEHERRARDQLLGI